MDASVSKVSAPRPPLSAASPAIPAANKGAGSFADLLQANGTGSGNEPSNIERPARADQGSSRDPSPGPPSPPRSDAPPRDDQPPTSADASGRVPVPRDDQPPTSADASGRVPTPPAPQPEPARENSASTPSAPVPPTPVVADQPAPPPLPGGSAATLPDGRLPLTVPIALAPLVPDADAPQPAVPGATKQGSAGLPGLNLATPDIPSAAGSAAQPAPRPSEPATASLVPVTAPIAQRPAGTDPAAGTSDKAVSAETSAAHPGSRRVFEVAAESRAEPRALVPDTPSSRQVAVEPPPPPGPPGQASGSSIATDAAKPAGHAAGSAMAQTSVPVQAVVPMIMARAAAGHSRFDIRLDPPELGRIDVTLSLDKEGRVRSKLVVEKPETYELLQRDQRNLERALTQAGLTLEPDGLEFSLGHDSAQGEQDRPQRPNAWAQANSTGDTTPPPAALAASYQRLALLRGGIDLSV